MSIQVLSGGPQTTVQDGGRIGYQQFGVSVSGVSDPRSFRIANILVGNAENEAVLEAAMLGPTLTFTKANTIAVTGGDFIPMVDGTPVGMYRAVSVAAGQTLSFGTPRAGFRCFIAFAGGLDIPLVMGSRSTFMKGALGGHEGRCLAAGDCIGFRAPVARLVGAESRCLPPEDCNGNEWMLRVVLGPQDEAFTAHGMETFLGTAYGVTNELDRMGCRLLGEAIEHVNGGDIISDGISFGAVQVPTQGQPIIMMADRQTTGGYTKIANVITTDFCRIAQLKPGMTVRFAAVSIAEAQDLYLAEREALADLRKSMDARALASERRAMVSAQRI